jgi:hypothetical protein
MKRMTGRLVGSAAVLALLVVFSASEARASCGRAAVVRAGGAAGQTDENAPRRIRFGRGTTSAKVSGTLRRTRRVDEVHYYVIRVRAGQRMRINVATTSGAAAISVGAPNGDQVSEGVDDRFDGEVFEAGDYQIRVYNPSNGRLGSTRYTLTVSVR